MIGLTMKLKVDHEADALYLRLDDSKIVESEEVSPGVVLDYNEQEQVVGVEILGISKRAPTLNTRELQFQTVQALNLDLLRKQMRHARLPDRQSRL
jgi:uncharacterized protein YuzE